MIYNTNRSMVVVNRIFGSIKTITPFSTSKTAEPVIYARYSSNPDKQNEADQLAKLLQTLFKAIYKNLQLQKLNEANMVNRYIYKV